MDNETLSKRVDTLAGRVDDLQERISSGSCDGGAEQSGPPAEMYHCSMPVRPQREFGPEVSVDRASAILTLGKKWVNGTELKYYMFDSGQLGGDSSQQEVVRRAFEVWTEVGIGLSFKRVSEISESEIRIGFLRGNGSWSTVGTDALNVPQSQRTMNFGWNIDVSGPNGLDTAVHEIGHALGFNHEHQNPNAGIIWNEQAVYNYFARTQTPAWDRDKTDFNILDKLDPQSVDGSTWDPDSIMHYAFASGLIDQPAQYRSGLRPGAGLSQKDQDEVKRFFPDEGSGSVFPQLKPWESQFLSLAPGEQKNFNVLPTETRDYDFRTFGFSDTVMVLFEEDGADFRFVKGDDDSGWDRNASFRVRLVRDRKYQLRIRLYFSSSSGDSAVMMW